MSDLVLVDRPGEHVALLTLNRPDRLNALTHDLVAELHDRLRVVGADPAVRAIVLTGAGRGFCAGIDLGGPGAPASAAGWGGPGEGFAAQQHIAELVLALRRLRQPVISAVNGPAAGGGFALALASDVRVADRTARFNAAFVRIGLSGCDIGVSWLLPRLIGAGRAWELLLTGRLVDADEADRLGLLTRLVAEGGAVDAALEIAEAIAANSPFGVWMTKEVMWSQLEVGSLQAGIDLENRTQILSTFSDDHREAVAAFTEKRPPRFRRA